MAAFNKFNIFCEDLVSGVHNLTAAGDIVRVYLSNATPDAELDAVKADLATITEENGYSASDVTNAVSRSTTTTSVTSADTVVWTGTGAGFGAFRYVAIYNDGTAVKTDPLIGWWDYTSSISVLAGETFTVDFGTSLFTIS